MGSFALSICSNQYYMSCEPLSTSTSGRFPSGWALVSDRDEHVFPVPAFSNERSIQRNGSDYFIRDYRSHYFICRFVEATAGLKCIDVSSSFRSSPKRLNPRSVLGSEPHAFRNVTLPDLHLGLRAYEERMPRLLEHTIMADHFRAKFAHASAHSPNSTSVLAVDG